MSCKKKEKKRKSKQKNKANISIKALCTTSTCSVSHRHTWAPWVGCFPPTLGWRGRAPDRIHFPPLPSSALIPGPGCTDLQTLHQHSLATRGTEERKARRRLPLCKRQPATPQKKLWFSLSVASEEWEVRAQLQPPSVLGTRKTPSAQPGLRAWCTQQPLAGRTRQQLLGLLGLCIKKWNSKARGEGVGRGTHTTNRQQHRLCRVRFVSLPTVFWLRKHYEQKSTNKTSPMIV